MTRIQNYVYHTHNDALGIFDGRSTADEMISQAEELGFDTIGVSNHLCLHKNAPQTGSKMFLRDANEALDIYKRMYAEIDEVASRHKIKVLKGFEVDYFPSKEWRNTFEKVIKQLDYDYLIGASHFICSADESYMCNIYHLDALPTDTTKEQLNEYLHGYWNNVIGAVDSGYFDFMAHMDYCTQFNLCTTPEWDETKWKLIDTVTKYKHPFEINTGGIGRIGRPFPDWWIAKELIKREIPVIISCDSHHVSHIGRHFDEVEEFLAQQNCKNRFKLAK